MQTILKKLNLVKFGQIGKLFSYIKLKHKEITKSFTKRPYVKTSHHIISESKICFEPNREKLGSETRARKIRLLETSDFPVYLYNERTGTREIDIKLKMPRMIVKKCMDLINEKDDQHLKYKAKTLEDHFDLHNVKQKMKLGIKK